MKLKNISYKSNTSTFEEGGLYQVENTIGFDFLKYTFDSNYLQFT